MLENNDWSTSLDSTCTESDLTFLGNCLEDEGHNDLFLHNWPELEVFENVDDVFRSCLENSDNFSWFPASHTIEGFTDALAPSFDFPVQEEVHGQRKNGAAVDETCKEVNLTSCKRDSVKLFPDNHHTDATSEMHSYVNPSKHQKTSEVKKTDHFSENVVSYIRFDKPSEAGTGTSIMKSEYNSLPAISSGGLSHVSNQLQTKQNRKKRKSHQCKSSRHKEKSNLAVQRADSDESDPLYGNKQIRDGENEAEGQSGLSSCTSSDTDDVSIDTSCLKQLQQVMGQLDTTTRLCIRDSLYRLASSAAQRNNFASGALLSDEANKCTGFIETEKDTNPIDRSIAHLLFHRPSDISAASTVNDVAMQSRVTVEPVRVEETILFNEKATKPRNWKS